MTILHTLSRYLIGASLLICCQLTLAKADYDLGETRAVYQQAVLGLKSSAHFNPTEYQNQRQILEQYPLSPYLDFLYLKRQFDALPIDSVSDFLERHDGSYIAHKMRSYWLAYLARNKQWVLYKAFYKETNNKSQQCSSLLSELALGADENDIFTETTQLWLSAYSLPNSCNNLFQKWEHAGYLTADITWQRFQMAYASNQIKLAKYLSRKLSGKQQKLAQQLLQPEANAQRLLDQLSNNNLPLELDSATLNRLMRKLSGKHHERVSQIIELTELPINGDDTLAIKKLSAWYMAKSDANKAQQWLKQFSVKPEAELQEFELRYALQAKDWRNYKRVYLQADAAVQQKSEWLYWYAKAQTLSGKHALNPERHPNTILQRLSQQRHFYGFLAADSQNDNADYAIATVQMDIDIDEQMSEQLAAALELYALGENLEANRAWHYATRRFNQQQWQQAAKIADSHQWYERSIQAHAKAQLWDIVDARFPLAYADEFKKHSQQQSINTSWLLAMARQESGFSPFATSHVGAKGILQLMPNTARRVAKSLNMRFDANMLTDPAYNITLGSKYLKDLLLRFDNNYILATAAYNAGPHRVDEWLGLRPITDDWAHWVATIPYEETRKYVQNILTYSIIYEDRLENPMPLLSEFANKQFSRLASDLTTSIQ